MPHRPPSWVKTQHDLDVWLAGEAWRRLVDHENRLRELLRGPRRGEPTIHPSSPPKEAS